MATFWELLKPEDKAKLAWYAKKHFGVKLTPPPEPPVIVLELTPRTWRTLSASLGKRYRRISE